MSRGFTFPGASALRFRDFRLFWGGYLAEVSGQQMLWVAQGWLIYELSGSALLLGAAGLARALPATVLTFVGGALADKLDQRKLLIGVQVIQVALLTLLGVLAINGTIEVWHLLVLISASAAAQSFENPARQAIFPRLVPRAALMDAVSLNTMVHPSTRFVGPFVGGLLMSQVRLATGDPLLGPALLFFLTAGGYLLNAGMIYLIRLEPLSATREHTSVFADMAAGVRYVVQDPIFGALILMTYCTQFFGWSFQSLFPIFVKDIFHGGEFELGLMSSSLGAGSIVGAVLASNLSNVRGRGRVIIAGFLAPAALLMAFAVSPTFLVALVLLFLIGLTQSVFNVLVQSTLQFLVPNAFRGRVMGIWGMTHTAVQPMGQLALGAIAAIFASAPVAVAAGGAAMIAYGVLLAIPNAHVRNLALSTEHVEEPAPAGVRH